jgi:hypothetical protein
MQGMGKGWGRIKDKVRLIKAQYIYMLNTKAKIPTGQ